MGSVDEPRRPFTSAWCDMRHAWTLCSACGPEFGRPQRLASFKYRFGNLVDESREALAPGQGGRLLSALLGHRRVADHARDAAPVSDPPGDEQVQSTRSCPSPFLIGRVHVAHRSLAGVVMKRERRRKRSSTCTRAEAATERKLSWYSAANYRPFLTFTSVESGRWKWHRLRQTSISACHDARGSPTSAHH